MKLNALKHRTTTLYVASIAYMLWNTSAITHYTSYARATIRISYIDSILHDAEKRYTM